MTPNSHNFKRNAVKALHDESLQRALAKARGGFVDKRIAAIEQVPEFEALRDQGRDIKNHALAHLPHYLEQYEAKVQENGGQVHWAQSPQEACDAILDICRKAGAKKVTKGKSMVGEEVAINPALEEAGFEVIETDLGEYIIQLAEEPPSHIIAPAVHKNKEQIAQLFREHHSKEDIKRDLSQIPDLVNEARRVLREQFLSADVGITGANFLVAETGQNIIVTNEGNGDLTATLPRVHIVIAGIEKVLPTLEDASALLRILARSATGQPITSYTTFHSGPRREGELDGPEEYHVVLVDNGRTEMFNNEFREMLRCIRCGACMNHCPVYGSIGGHAYGWVYPGPMGSVLTPNMIGLKEAGDLPNACTLNGRCKSVCPVRIPLPDMLRAHRRRQYEQGLTDGRWRIGLKAWAWFAQRPRLYQFMSRSKAWILGRLGQRRGAFRSVPMAGGWTRSRDLPAPQGETFQAAWKRRQRGEA